MWDILIMSSPAILGIAALILAFTSIGVKQ